MLTQLEIREFIEKDVLRVTAPPPIDDFQDKIYRRLTIEFKANPTERFGTKMLVEQPYHYEKYRDRKGEMVETKIYDPWDESTWVERGKNELLDLYSGSLFVAQSHLSFLTQEHKDE